VFVEYWPVGSSTSQFLPMTDQDIAAHLAADWMPSLPSAVSSSLIGWPSRLLEAVQYRHIQDVLALIDGVRRHERQWKGVLSWMLGVAGTRHVLASEGYRWVAPLSAFYPERVQPIDIAWNEPSFPSALLKATPNPSSGSRLRPDYVAIRPAVSTETIDAYEWAIVESKGHSKPLQACPDSWRKQAKNAILTFDSALVTVERHLVVATRVNPNAAKKPTRRLQLRAWNANEQFAPDDLRPRAAVEIASAHVFGLFNNVRLYNHARAVAWSVRSRSAGGPDRLSPGEREQFLSALTGVDAERDGRQSEDARGRPVTLGRIAIGDRELDVEIAEPLMNLGRALAQAHDVASAASALRSADSELSLWQDLSRSREIGSFGQLGVRVRLPPKFDR
jgi:hypothetical protein